MNIVPREFQDQIYADKFPEKLCLKDPAATGEKAETNMTIPVVNICQSNHAVGTGYKKNGSICNIFIEDPV